MDDTQESFTSEEICEQAKGNVAALSLLLLTYARDRGNRWKRPSYFSAAPSLLAGTRCKRGTPGQRCAGRP